MLYMEELSYDIRVTLHKKKKIHNRFKQKLTWFKQYLLAISNQYYYKNAYIGLSNKKILFKALS